MTVKAYKGKISHMLDYAICEINGSQIKVVPNKEILVPKQVDSKDLEVNVLLLSEGGKVQLGKPYLKEKLTLKNLGEVKGEKVRVSKFHAKANYRKVIGSRAKLTKVVLSVKS